MPQYDGLFDFQNMIRPAYFTFKLLSRLGGERLEVDSSDPAIHAFLTRDPVYDVHNFLVWNYSPEAVRLKLTMNGVPPGVTVAKRRRLDAAAPENDENVRLLQLGDIRVNPAAGPVEIELEPYGIEFWSLEGK